MHFKMPLLSLRVGTVSEHGCQERQESRHEFMVFSFGAPRVKETIAGGRGQQYMQDLHKCPLHYERIPYEDIR